MASGYKVNGIDLDEIFAPYSSGTKAATTGYQVAGVDLKDRYQKYTSGPKAPATNRKVGGIDLNDIFAPAVGLSNHSVSVIGAVASGQAVAGIRLSNDGTLQERKGSTFTTISGEWLLAGSASNYEARASGQASNHGIVTGTFNSWLDLGTTRSWAVQDTDPTSEVTADLSFTLEIRRKDTGAVVASAVITLFVDYTDD